MKVHKSQTLNKKHVMEVALLCLIEISLLEFDEIVQYQLTNFLRS